LASARLNLEDFTHGRLPNVFGGGGHRVQVRATRRGAGWWLLLGIWPYLAFRAGSSVTGTVPVSHPTWHAMRRTRRLRLVSVPAVVALTAAVFTIDVSWLYTVLLGVWLLFIAALLLSWNTGVTARVQGDGHTVMLDGIDPELATALRSPQSEPNGLGAISSGG
jgi:hypothetical protein